MLDFSSQATLLEPEKLDFSSSAIPVEPEVIGGDDYLNELMVLENSQLAKLPDDHVVYPNTAPEKDGGWDIGFGHKITPAEAQAGMIYDRPYDPQKGLTVKDLREILKQDVLKHQGEAEKLVGVEKFNSLPEEAKMLFTDYSFTGVLDKFPKFRQAILDQDYDTAIKEYTRYMTDKDGKKKPLGARNRFALTKLLRLQAAASPQGPPAGESLAELPSLPDSSASLAGDIGRQVVESPLAAVEGLGSIGSGVLSFGPGVGVGLGAGIQALMEGAPISEAMAKGGEEMEKFMSAFTYQPKTEGGQALAEVGAMPFALAHEAISATVLAAGGDETDVKAWQFAFDSALALAPHGAVMKDKLKRGEKLSKEEIQEVKTAVEGIDKTLDTTVLDNVLGEVGKLPDKKIEAPKATVESNQHIVDRLVEEANSRPDGARKNNYKKAAEKVAKWEVDASEADLREISKSKGKTRDLIEKLVEEREVEPTVVDRSQVVGQKMEPEFVDPGKLDFSDQSVPDFQAQARAEMQERIAKAKREREIRKSATGQRMEAEMVEPKAEEAKAPEQKIDPLVAEEGVPEAEVEVGPTRAELDAEAKLLEEDLLNLEKEMKETKDPEVKKRTTEDLIAIHDAWKQRYVEKINEANKAETKVAAEDIGTFNNDFKVFKTEAEAREFAEKNGIEQEVIVDPATGEAFFEPILDKLENEGWERDLEMPMDDFIELGEAQYEGGVGLGELGDTGTRSLWDIINNERGSVSVTELRIANEKLKELKAQAERVGKSVEELLDGMSLSPESRNAILKAIEELPKNEEKVRELDPINEGIFNPKGDILYQRAKRNKKTGEVRVKPAVTVELAGKLLKANKLDPVGVVGSIMDSLEIRINRFERFGSGLKEQFYDNWLAKLAESKREVRAIKAEMVEDLKGISKKDREAMSIVAHSRQKNGPELLAKMGIEEIPTLSSRQEALVQKYQDKLSEFRDRINYVRGHIGLKPLGKIDNYFPWIHQINEMKKAKILDNGLGMNLKNFSGHSKQFKGNFFPFAERRGSKPSAIELDIFDGFETYVKGAVKEIHLNPIAALAKEAAQLKMGKGKGGVKLEKINPQLAKLLTEWSDEILGIDPAYSGAAAKAGKLAEFMENRIINLTVATLFGTVSTALKQPLALIGVYSETGLRSTLEGLGQVGLDKTPRRVSKARAKSNVLEVRTMDLMFSEMAENISKKGIAGVRDSAAMIAASPMTFLDAMTAEAGWNAGYGFAKRKLKLGETEAIRWADDLVARTQGVGVRGAVSPIQSSKITKWGTLFQTFAINDFNYVARDLLGIRKPNIKKVDQVKKVLRYVAASALANTVFMIAGMDPPKPSPVGKFKEVKNEGETDQQAVAQALMEFVEIVPIIGGAIKYDSSALGAAGEFAKEVPEALGATVEMIDWAGMTRKERINNGLLIGSVLGKWYGIPMTNQIKKGIRAAVNGGTPYETILGIYVKEAKKFGPQPPSIPKLPQLP